MTELTQQTKTIAWVDPRPQAVQALTMTGLEYLQAMIDGEITKSCYVEFQKIVRENIKEVGYTRAEYGFDSETCDVLSSIYEQ